MEMRDDVFVYLVDMPSPKVREAVLPCEGGHTVYIDSKLTMEEQQEAYVHALRHVDRNDCLDDCRCVDEKERVRR